MTERDILYENGNYWVSLHVFGKSKGFAVWEAGITHSQLVASIGYSGDLGLTKAINEANKRAESLRNKK